MVESKSLNLLPNKGEASFDWQFFLFIKPLTIAIHIVLSNQMDLTRPSLSSSIFLVQI